MRNGWEICREREARVEKERRVYVSLNRRGEIAMNAEAFRMIGRPASVALLYDDKTRRVGVKCPVEEDGNFFRVRRYGRGGRMRVVRAARLLKQFAIKVERPVFESGNREVSRIADAGAPLDVDWNRSPRRTQL